MELVWGLLWECVDLEINNFYSDIAPTRSETYRAPSWSWVAGDGAVAWIPVDKPEEVKEEVVIVGGKDNGSRSGPSWPRH